jgi:hypothetical protein
LRFALSAKPPPRAAARRPSQGCEGPQAPQHRRKAAARSDLEWAEHGGKIGNAEQDPLPLTSHRSPRTSPPRFAPAPAPAFAPAVAPAPAFAPAPAPEVAETQVD